MIDTQIKLFIDMLKDNKYISPFYEIFITDMLSVNDLNDVFISNILEIELGNYFSQVNYDYYRSTKEKIYFYNVLSEFIIKHDIELFDSQSIFTFVTNSNKNLIPIVMHIYNKLNPNEKSVISNRLLTFIYIKLLQIASSYDNSDNILDIDLEYTTYMFNTIQDLVIFLVENKIVNNSLVDTDPEFWPEDIDDNEEIDKIIQPESVGCVEEKNEQDNPTNKQDKESQQDQTNSSNEMDQVTSLIIGNSSDLSDESSTDSFEEDPISFFDFMFYSIFIANSKTVTIFIFLLIEKLYNKKLANAKNLFKGKTNFHSIYEINQYFPSDNRKIEILESQYNSIDLYKFTFLSVILKIYLKFKNEYYLETNIGQIFNEYFSNIFSIQNIKIIGKKIINFSNSFSTNDMIEMLSDFLKINSEYLNNYIIYNLKLVSENTNSTDKLTQITQTYIFVLISRLLIKPSNLLKYDYKLDHYYYDDKTVVNGLLVTNKEIVSEELYVENICNYINKLDKKLQEYIINLVDNYINNIYKYLIDKEKELFETDDMNNNDNNKCCAICLDDFVSDEKNDDSLKVITESELETKPVLCYGCRNFYHHHCLIKWANQKALKKCPLCARCIHSVIMINKNEKYRLFTKVLEKLLVKL